jgi:hypothetical protein
MSRCNTPYDSDSPEPITVCGKPVVGDIQPGDVIQVCDPETGKKVNKTYVLPEDANTTNVSLEQTGTDLILTDSDGNSVTADVSGLISPPDVDFASTTSTVSGTTVTTQYFDADGNLITTDTYTLPNVVDNGDGTFTYNGVTWATDDDVTAFSLDIVGTDLVGTVTEGGTVVTGSISQADLQAFLDTDTNTTNTSLVVNAAGQLVLTDSDGNTVQTSNSVISPPDTDFASTTHTYDANGDLVITYLDSDGNTIEVSDPIEMDRISPAKAPVTNPDGSTTICHDLLNADGSVDTVDYICTFKSAPSVASVTDGGSNLVDNTDPLNPEINPITDECGDVIDVTNTNLAKAGSYNDELYEIPPYTLLLGSAAISAPPVINEELLPPTVALSISPTGCTDHVVQWKAASRITISVAQNQIDDTIWESSESVNSRIYSNNGSSRGFQQLKQYNPVHSSVSQTTTDGFFQPTSYILNSGGTAIFTRLIQRTNQNDLADEKAQFIQVTQGYVDIVITPRH